MIPEALRTRYPGLTTFTFGDSEALSQELQALVRSGAKTATCGALRDYEADPEPLPEAGGFCAVLDWDESPALILKIRSVEILRFDAVGEDFALAEGEGDYEDWRDGHQRYFERNGGFDPAMPLVCLRFAVVEDLKPPGTRNV